jgi:RsiW-degrading membrane proteinase PrsW (M82 family)
MIISESIKSNRLAYIGFILPYIAILVISVFVYLVSHKTIDLKWKTFIGAVALFVPLGVSLLGAVLVGVNTVKHDKIIKSRKATIHGFIFSFFWTAVFHFFITMYFFMQIVYVYAGMEH